MRVLSLTLLTKTTCLTQHLILVRMKCGYCVSVCMCAYMCVYMFVFRVWICSSKTTRGCFGSYIECCISNAYPLVCLHKLSHDSKHERGLAVSHTAPYERFGERTDTHSRIQQYLPVPLVKAQEAAMCQRCKWTLFVPMAASSEGEALVRMRHPRS